METQKELTLTKKLNIDGSANIYPLSEQIDWNLDVIDINSIIKRFQTLDAIYVFSVLESKRKKSEEHFNIFNVKLQEELTFLRKVLSKVPKDGSLINGKILNDFLMDLVHNIHYVNIDHKIIVKSEWERLRNELKKTCKKIMINNKAFYYLS